MGSHCNMSHCNMSHCNISHCNMSHCNMSHCNMSHGNMSHYNMSHGNMSHCNMSHGYMSHCYMLYVIMLQTRSISQNSTFHTVQSLHIVTYLYPRTHHKQFRRSPPTLTISGDNSNPMQNSFRKYQETSQSQCFAIDLCMNV